jgi:DNA repair exonuclease SbcCD ATPase subunit
MLLEDVFHRIEAGFENLGRYLFTTDPQAKRRGEIAALTDDLRGRHELLRNTRKKLKDALRRLEENQQTVVLLSSRIELAVKRGEGAHAWHLALEVDKLRQEIVQDRERLPRYEQTVWSIEFKIRQQVRELAQLQEQLYGIPEVQRA